MSEQELIDDQLPWVRIQAWRFAKNLYPQVLYDDIYQCGCIGLIQAARSYEPKRSNWRQHASINIRRAIVNGIRSETRKQKKPDGTWGGMGTLGKLVSLDSLFSYQRRLIRRNLHLISR